MQEIYLDYNASTPIVPEVADAMRPFLEGSYGNPSSGHWAAAPARNAVSTARGEVAALLGAAPHEIVLTSGGTEANNHAIKGIYHATRDRMAAGRTPHVITSAVEHPAVLEPCAFIERLGARITRLPVDGWGRVDPAAVERAVTPETVLISVMHANNEVGTVQPLADIGAIAREHAVVFHTDAAQSAGKIPVAVDALGVDLLSLAGHKLYGPKGVGALYVRTGLRHRLEPLLHGAGHEDGRRAGTESVLLIAGLGAACRLAREAPAEPHLAAMTDALWDRLRHALGDRIRRLGHPVHRLPNTLNVCLRNVDADTVLGHLAALAASTGSACHAGSTTISPVLRAMGIDDEWGRGAIRLSTGRPTTREEVDTAADLLIARCQPPP